MSRADNVNWGCGGHRVRRGSYDEYDHSDEELYVYAAVPITTGKAVAGSTPAPIRCGAALQETGRVKHTAQAATFQSTS